MERPGKAAGPAAAPILFCAATRWEAEPLVRRFKLSRTAAGRFEGRFSGRALLLLKTGAGPDLCGRNLERLPGAQSFGRALSLGFAGALKSGIKSGELIADFSGAGDETERLAQNARECARKTGLALHVGRIADSCRVAATPAQKKTLGSETGAWAVDMETAAIRRWAGARRIPLLALRAALDELEDELPAELPAGEDIASLARYAAGHWRLTPSLIRLGWKQRRAMSGLTRFLEEFLPCL